MDATHTATEQLPRTIDLTDDLEAIALRLAHRYREVRRTVDVTGTLFSRHELQSALILVRRLRRQLGVDLRESVPA